MQELDFYLKLMLTPKGKELAHAFGPGTAELLRGVRSHKSLNQAAKDMGMAYSKAWQAINNTEALFGFELMQRKRPEGSELTKEGEALLDLFDEISSEASKAVEKALKNWGKRIGKQL